MLLASTDKIFLNIRSNSSKLWSSHCYSKEQQSHGKQEPPETNVLHPNVGLYTYIFFDITDTSVSREGTSRYSMTQIWGTLLWTQHQWQCPPALSMCQCAAAHWQLQGENVSMELQILGGKRPFFFVLFYLLFSTFAHNISVSGNADGFYV